MTDSKKRKTEESSASQEPSSPLQHWDLSARKLSFPKNKIKVLLLENIHETAVEMFQNEGFNVESLKSAMTERELKAKIADVHLIGVRSKTKLSSEVLNSARRLKAIGCFCIGTDQTDLPCAEGKGVPVFNSPFSNSRSVAELALSHIISLSRRVPDNIRDLHNRVWNKSAEGCHEVRGKTLGIIGYGHIGTQLGVLAEAIGMKVIFYDIRTIMPMGSSTPTQTMEELLRLSDYVSLHVPENETTVGMIRYPQLEKMKRGSFLLNLARGRVVDLGAVKEALSVGHLAGVAVDVYPEEPEKNGNLPPDIIIPLIGCKNTILTPHVGGSTLEAQEAIGKEVASKMIRFMNMGCSEGAVNFPNITPPPSQYGQHRILHVHRNVPGVLMSVNNLLGHVGNISYQHLLTNRNIGYLIIDVEAKFGAELTEKLSQLSATINSRILY